MLRVRAIYTGVTGTPWYSNVYFDGTGSSVAQAAVDSLRAFLQSFQPALSQAVDIDLDPFVPQIDPADGAVVGGFTVNPGAQIGGSDANNMLPAQTQALLALRTGTYVAGRQIAGKFYVPGMCEDNNTASGTPSSDLLGFLEDGFNDMLASGPDVLVWSRKNGVAPAVQTVVAKTQWAVLRSRRD